MNPPSALKWIRNGRIITATEDFIGDLLIGNGQVLAMGKNLNGLGWVGTHGCLTNVEEIAADGLLIFPGGIDVHTHLDLPFMGTSSSDDFETGTRAALAGGTTSIIDFAIQEPGKTLREALNRWLEKATGKATIDYSFHLGVTDLNPATLAEVPHLIEFGITSFKCFMAYKGTLCVDDGQILTLMKTVKKYGGIVTAHCENAEVIDTLSKDYLNSNKTSPLYHELSHPTISEGEATHRFIALSRLAGHPGYVVHLSCEEALREIQRSLTESRQTVFAETCPQYLLLDRGVYEKPGFESAKWVMSPPIRTQRDQEALWAGLRDGFIQTIATDHCPFYYESQKKLGKDCFTRIPNGAPGIENRMNLLFTYGVLKNRISLNRYVQLLCTHPAKIFGLFPRKGTLAPGSDADLVLFDPQSKNTISSKTSHQRCDYSAFEGFDIQGEPISVLSKGEWVLKDKKIVARKGAGQFLKRSRYSQDQMCIR